MTLSTTLKMLSKPFVDLMRIVKYLLEDSDGTDGDGDEEMSIPAKRARLG